MVDKIRSQAYKTHNDKYNENRLGDSWIITVYLFAVEEETVNNTKKH